MSGLLLRVITIFLLGKFIHPAEGNKRMINVTHNQWSEAFFSNRKLPPYHKYGDCLFHDALVNLTNNTVINITTNVELLQIIKVVGFANISITGHNNPIVNCKNHGGLHIVSCNNCTIEGITWDACGAKNISNTKTYFPAIQLHNSSNVAIKNCSFRYSVGQALVLTEMSTEIIISHSNFLFNIEYQGHGAAVHYSSNITFGYPLKFKIDDCTFSYNERAESIVYLGHSSNNPYELLHLHNSRFSHNIAVSIYLTNQTLHVTGNIVIHNNTAENGSGIFISDYSNVLIHKSTNICFENNTANSYGGSIYLTNHSSILFKDIFTLNNYQDDFDKEIFVTFYQNQASRNNGGAIHAVNSHITFGESTTVIFNKNIAGLYGGAVSVYKSTTTFEGNSSVEFNPNKVIYGRSTHVADHSTIALVRRSLFSNSFTDSGGGGAMYIGYWSTMIFKGNSKVRFTNNKANSSNGGSLYVVRHSVVMFLEKATVLFNYNKASAGGALYVSYNSFVTFGEISNVMFINNQADMGGANYITHTSAILYDENSIIAYYGNNAFRGGALFIYNISHITFQGNTTATFKNNTATQSGGVFHCYRMCNISFKQNSETYFIYNKALQGGAIYSLSGTYNKFKGNSRVNFTENTALGYGGAIYSDTNCFSTFSERTRITFDGNKAKGGGAIYSYSTSIIVTDNTLLFNNNSAEKGGAFLIKLSNVKFSGNSCISFTNNTALQDGGAIYLNDHSNFISSSKQIYSQNTASNYGGAIFIQMKEVSVNTNTSRIYFDDNYAGSTNRPVYINVPKSCNKSCLFESIKSTNLPVATSPSKLILHNPAKCIHT